MCSPVLRPGAESGHLGEQQLRMATKTAAAAPLLVFVAGTVSFLYQCVVHISQI